MGCLLHLRLRVFALQFPPSCGSSCLTSASLSGPSESFGGQVDFLCFHCPPYQFLFCPSYGSSRYRLTCRGNAAPGGIPPLRPPSPLSSFLISLSPTDPRSRYPLTSLLFSVTTWSSSRAHWPSSSSAKTQRGDMDRRTPRGEI